MTIIIVKPIMSEAYATGFSEKEFIVIIIRSIILESYRSRIDIRTIKQTFQNKLTTLIVDQNLCLTVELKDDSSEENSEEAIGLATYSNSEANRI